MWVPGRRIFSRRERVYILVADVHHSCFSSEHIKSKLWSCVRYIHCKVYTYLYLYVLFLFYKRRYSDTTVSLCVYFNRLLSLLLPLPLLLLVLIHCTIIRVYVQSSRCRAFSSLNSAPTSRRRFNFHSRPYVENFFCVICFFFFTSLNVTNTLYNCFLFSFLLSEHGFENTSFFVFRIDIIRNEYHEGMFISINYFYFQFFLIHLTIRISFSKFHSCFQYMVDICLIWTNG